MMRQSRWPRAVLPVLALVFVAGSFSPATGQTLVGSGGLGIPVEALDGRARALGGVGIGLSGAQVLPEDPSAAAGIGIPTVTATMQPSAGTIRDGEEEMDVGGTRFPLVGIAYPVRPTSTVLVSFGSFLDQEWQTVVDRTLVIGDRPVQVEDTYLSEGGVSSFRVGWAEQVSETVSVGVAGGAHAGRLFREFTRSLDEEDFGDAVEAFRDTGEWRVRAPTLTASVTWDPSDLIRLAGGVTWSGSLQLDAVAGFDVEEREYPMPLRWRVGTTVSLAPELELVAGVTYADWTDTGAALRDGGTVGSTLTVGGGVEWTGFQLRGRPVPVRLGYHRADLPFHFQGAEASEDAFSGGIGVTLADAEIFPLAHVELGFERLDRDAGPLSEELWRTTVSLRVSGG